MKAYMTNGTVDFLAKIADDHPELTFFIMTGPSSTLVYYEDNQKSIFAAGREYEILLNKGNIQEEGFVVMNHIPIADEGKPVFEQGFQRRQHAVESMPGFHAYRLLKPLKGNTYVVLTQWAREKDYNAWKNSEEFSKAHQASSVKQPAYFLEQPFASTYSMYDPEKED